MSLEPLEKFVVGGCLVVESDFSVKLELQAQHFVSKVYVPNFRPVLHTVP